MGNKYTKDELEKNEQASLRASKGDLTTYSGMLGDGFRIKKDWLSQILGDAHYSSLGRYKENLLKNVVVDFLPSRYSVGTGFVIFPKENEHQTASSDERLRLPEHQVSRQLDLIVYDSSNYPLVFKDGDFVVVRPEAVRSIVEVKGGLDQKGIDGALDLFIDYGRKWQQVKQLYKPHSHYPKIKAPFMYLMAWEVGVAKGYPKTDGERLRKRIVSRYSSQVSKSEIPGFPTLRAAYIYDDCIVRATFAFETSQYGYYTTQGKLTRFDQNGKAEAAGDKTIIDLLAGVQRSLETPFNESFAHVDQTNRIDVLPHKFQGFACWLKGDNFRLALPSDVDE